MRYNNIVFSGGAFKACAFIGCIKYLQEKDVKNIRNVIGSSAGSIIGFMYCTGIEPSEMQEYMNRGMKEYLKQDIDVDALFDIFDTMGIDDGHIFIDIMKEFLEKKYGSSKLNFRDFAKLTGKNFVVPGSNISLAKIEYFCVDTTPEMNVIDAIRISISLPFVMKPVIMNNYIYVDASVFDNFPIEYFDSASRPFQDTLALLISAPTSLPNTNELNLFKFTRVLIDALFSRVNQKIDSVGKNNLIINFEFPDDNYGFDTSTLKLHMDENKLLEYITFGYETTKKWLEK